MTCLYFDNLKSDFLVCSESQPVPLYRVWVAYRQISTEVQTDFWFSDFISFVPFRLNWVLFCGSTGYLNLPTTSPFEQRGFWATFSDSASVPKCESGSEFFFKLRIRFLFKLRLSSVQPKLSNTCHEAMTFIKTTYASAQGRRNGGALRGHCPPLPIQRGVRGHRCPYISVS